MYCWGPSTFDMSMYFWYTFFCFVFFIGSHIIYFGILTAIKFATLSKLSLAHNQISDWESEMCNFSRYFIASMSGIMAVKLWIKHELYGMSRHILDVSYFAFTFILLIWCLLFSFKTLLLIIPMHGSILERERSVWNMCQAAKLDLHVIQIEGSKIFILF